MSEKIIEIDFKKQPLEIKRRQFDSCSHVKLYIWEQERKVTCQTCDTELDIFQVLLDISYKVRRIIERDKGKATYYEEQAEKHITWKACRKKRSCPLLDKPTRQEGEGR